MKLQFRGTLREFMSIAKTLDLDSNISVDIDGSIVSSCKLIFTGMKDPEKKIQAIKEVRNLTGMSLKDAKDLVESGTKQDLIRMPFGAETPETEFINVKLE